MTATGPQTATPEAQEDDWLTGQACMIREDGSIDPDCEACQ